MHSFDCKITQFKNYWKGKMKMNSISLKQQQNIEKTDSTLKSLKKYLNTSKKTKRLSEDLNSNRKKASLKESKVLNNRKNGNDRKLKNSNTSNFEDTGFLLNTMSHKPTLPLQASCDNFRLQEDFQMPRPKHSKMSIDMRHLQENRPIKKFKPTRFTKVSSPLSKNITKMHIKNKVKSTFEFFEKIVVSRKSLIFMNWKIKLKLYYSDNSESTSSKYKMHYSKYPFLQTFLEI